MVADAFGKSPLFIGGPVTKNLLHVLHGRRDVQGSLEIMDVSPCKQQYQQWEFSALLRYCAIDGLS
jgi:hypothetical protein